MPTFAIELTASLREFLSRRLIERAVGASGMAEIFIKGQSWQGYERACESWHTAYWKWVDHEALPEILERLKGLQINFEKLAGFDWSRVPGKECNREAWVQEQTRQEILQQWALFRVSMRGADAADPATYKMFVDDMAIASRLGIAAYFEELAKQKQRKPTKDAGDRRLRYYLLLWWIPGCLWALTTEGVAAFLNERYPRSGNTPYDKSTISDARRELKLYRTPRPILWGITGSPPRPVPLR